MGVFLRKVRAAFLVAMVLIVGGGFASALDNDGHQVTYEILSFRAVALSSTATVDFGKVRQGQVVETPGPTLKYATTFANDRVVVTLDSDTDYGVVLYLSADTPVTPSATPSAAPSIGGPACTAPGASGGSNNTDVPLSSSTPNAIIDTISNCGIDLDPYWVTAALTYKVDASLADGAGLMEAGQEIKTVTYTIEASP